MDNMTTFGGANWSNSTAFTSMDTGDVKLYGVIQAAIDLCLVPFIIGGNALVIIAILTTPKLQVPTNFFILSLAVADLLVGVLVLPIYSLYYLEVASAMKNKYLCLVRYATVICSCGGSLLNLVCIAVDRYIAIIYPLRYQALVTPFRVKVTIFVLWFYSVLMSLLPLMGWNKWTEDANCVIFKVMSPIWIILSDFLLGAVCLSLTIVLYARVFSVAYRQHKLMESTSSWMPDELRLRQKREIKSAKVMAFVLLMFVIFWVPYFVLAPMKYIDGVPADMIVTIKDFALCLSFSNSLINPIIYGFLRRDFKAAFKRFLFVQMQRYRYQRESSKRGQEKTVMMNFPLKYLSNFHSMSSAGSLQSLRSVSTFNTMNEVM
ncbi:adenosine receptor A2b-like [Haliotis rufescens]|uniref:adenosine receptor A2b-like n=1 Tax=Haliotis rufescens TaxID=6454 RepID=UPI00201F0D9D|nr:adenosine receptor A2b-like [Haliotis rufescens]